MNSWDPRRIGRAVLGMMIVGTTCTLALAWAFGWGNGEAEGPLMVMVGFTGVILTFFFQERGSEDTTTQKGT